MKICPSCNASNDDNATSCRECDESLANIPTRRKSEFRLVGDDEAVGIPPPPVARRSEAGPPGSINPAQQPGRAGKGSNFLIVVLFVLVLALSGALAYLILAQDALKNKEDFDRELAQIISSQRELEGKIESLQAQRDQLVADLSEKKKEYDRDMWALQGRLTELVKGKIPGTHSIEANKVVTVIEQNTEYAVKILRDSYEENVLRYEISIRNTQQTSLAPSSIELIVFNEDGLQIGNSSITMLDQFSGQQISQGEAKVTLGSVRLMSLGKPRFFLLQIR